MNSAVIDTNVLVVANTRSPQAGPGCVAAVVARLLNVQRKERVVLDLQGFIVKEYIQQRLAFAGQPGLGDAFFKWVFDNQANPKHVELVEIHPKNNSADDFKEFPVDERLAAFDRSDRKFVAAALASANKPSVLNAVDSDWWDYRQPLADHGVQIEFLCPEQFEDSAENGHHKSRARR